ncbi:hypothetical protein Tco_0580648 [Tanacetum coccineum]
MACANPLGFVSVKLERLPTPLPLLFQQFILDSSMKVLKVSSSLEFLPSSGEGGQYLLRKAFFKRSQVVIDPVDNCFIHCLALPFKVKRKAISITWSLDTPGEWKRYKGLKTKQKREFSGSIRSSLLIIQDQDEVRKIPRALQWKEHESTNPMMRKASRDSN